jgi:hypothetical protein
MIGVDTAIAREASTGLGYLLDNRQGQKLITIQSTHLGSVIQRVQTESQVSRLMS